MYAKTVNSFLTANNTSVAVFYDHLGFSNQVLNFLNLFFVGGGWGGHIATALKVSEFRTIPMK